MKSWVETLKRDEEEKKPISVLSRWSDKQSKAPEPIDWVVEKMLTAGDLTILVGDGGVGKSWKAAHIAMKVANGEMVDGLFKTKKGNVVWFDNENGPDENDRRCRILDRDLGFAGLRFKEFDVYFHEQHWAATATGLELLNDYIELHHPSLVIFDSLVSFLPEGTDENAATAVRSVMDGISNVLKFDKTGVKRENAPSGLILHHTRKGNDEEEWPTFRGSGDIKNAITFMIIMRQKTFEKDNGDIESRVQYRWEKARRGKKDDHIFEYGLKDHGEENTPSHWVEYISFGKASSFKEFIEDKILEAFLTPIERLGLKDFEERIETFPESKAQRSRLMSEMVKKGLLSADQSEQHSKGTFYRKIS